MEGKDENASVMLETYLEKFLGEWNFNLQQIHLNIANKMCAFNKMNV